MCSLVDWRHLFLLFTNQVDGFPGREGGRVGGREGGRVYVSLECVIHLEVIQQPSVHCWCDPTIMHVTVINYRELRVCIVCYTHGSGSSRRTSSSMLYLEFPLLVKSTSICNGYWGIKHRGGGSRTQINTNS
jgi:hypothetical protein